MKKGAFNWSILQLNVSLNS